MNMLRDFSLVGREGIMKLVMEVLAAFAALVVLLIVAFYITLAWQLSRDPVVSLDDPDVLHLYEWAGVDGDAAMLINSYHPPANWAGDYQKVFSVRLGPSTSRASSTGTG